MSKYRVVENSDNAGLGPDREKYSRSVTEAPEELDKDEDGMIGPLMTEAEAEIIAFALNTVSEGYTLAAVWNNGSETGVAETYDGPIDGVRKEAGA